MTEKMKKVKACLDEMNFVHQFMRDSRAPGSAKYSYGSPDSVAALAFDQCLRGDDKRIYKFISEALSDNAAEINAAKDRQRSESGLPDLCYQTAPLLDKALKCWGR